MRLQSHPTGELCDKTESLGEIGISSLFRASSLVPVAMQSLNVNTSRCRHQYTPYSEYSSAALFKAVGNGQNMRASIFAPEAQYYSVYISVYLGPCPTLQCFQESSAFEKEVVWKSEEGEDYYLLVHSCCDFAKSTDFVLVLQNSDRSPETRPPWETMWPSQTRHPIQETPEYTSIPTQSPSEAVNGFDSPSYLPTSSTGQPVSKIENNMHSSLSPTQSFTDEPSSTLTPTPKGLNGAVSLDGVSSGARDVTIPSVASVLVMYCLLQR